MSKERIYLDTSVISAYFDDRWPERQKETVNFFENSPEEYDLGLSNITFMEILKTGDENRRLEMIALAGQFQSYPITEAAEKLSAEFIAENLVPPSKVEDALHLAIAVERGFDYLASWNFSHMVNAKTQRKLPLISARHGYFKQTLIYWS